MGKGAEPAKSATGEKRARKSKGQNPGKGKHPQQDF